MKKLLLGSVLSTSLLLAACGGETEEDTTTESTTEEETREESDLTAENETLKEENQQLQEQISSLEEQLAEAHESTDEVDTEEVGEEVTDENSDAIALVEPNETLELDTINLTINGAGITHLPTNEMTAAAVMHKDVEPGDVLDVLAISYTLENTSEDPRNFFIDQAEIVTSTGEQIQPELLLSEGIQSQMSGAVKSEGVVIYILEDGSGEDVEWFDIVIPTVSDDEFNFYTEEENHRVEF